MTNYLAVSNQINGVDIPGPLIVTGSGSGTARSYRIMAWDTPEEIDLQNARWADTKSESENHVYTTVTFNWTPPKRKPHHYSIYMVAAATIGGSSVVNKILPASGLVNGNIPGYATTCTIASPGTGITEARNIPVDAVNVGTKTYTLRGDWTGLLYVAAGVTPDGGAPTTVTALDLTWTEQGVCTEVTTTAAPGGAETFLTITLGLMTTNSASNIAVIMYPTQSLSIEPRERLTRDMNGYDVPVSLLNVCPISGIEALVPHGSFTYTGGLAGTASAAAALYRLNQWHKNRNMISIFCETDSDVVRFPGEFPYRGYIDFVDSLGLRGFDTGPIRVRIRVNEFFDSTDYQGYYVITAASTANDTFTISGDYTKIFRENVKFNVVDSTSNDGFYAVESRVYSGGNTVITITGEVPSNTGDGSIHLWL